MNYYTLEVCQLILDSVYCPHWRTWKVIESNGRCRQNKYPIRTAKQLMWFVGNNCSKLYNSVSMFLNPHRVYGKVVKKSQWLAADNIFLGSELLFDIDHEDLSIAHKEAITILDFMSNQKEYQLINIRYSGNKGFHLLYKDLYPIKEMDPIMRRNLTQARREQLIKCMPTLSTINKHHQTIIADQFRVHASLYSKKQNGGIVTPIDYKDFMRLSTSELDRAYSLERHIVPMTKHDLKDKKVSSSSISGDERSRLSSNLVQGNNEHHHTSVGPAFYNFVDNRVRGTKELYVPVLKYPITMNPTTYIHKVQQRYKLGDFHSFVFQDTKYYICLDVVDKRRLIKIMVASKCVNTNSFQHFNHVWIPISTVTDKDNNIIDDAPGQHQIIYSEHIKPLSKPHAALYGLIGNVGKSENKIKLAMIA